MPKIWAVNFWDAESNINLVSVHASREGAVDLLRTAEDYEVVSFEDKAYAPGWMNGWYVLRRLSDGDAEWNEEYVITEMEVLK